MNDNPWHRLPTEPPYVLPEDQEKVKNFNLKAEQKTRQDHVLHLDLIPEPFVGRPDAPVVLLGNNPGVKNPESAAARRVLAFANRMRNNLLHRLSNDFPFLYLDPNSDIPPRNREWWDRKLKNLFREFGPDLDTARRILARSILAVEYFPYVSHRFGHARLSLSSQQYCFNLVRSAMERGAVIVLTRGQRRWEKAVADLAKYPHLVRLKEVQRAPISPGNCPDPDQYQAIVRAIRATLL